VTVRTLTDEEALAIMGPKRFAESQERVRRVLSGEADLVPGEAVEAMRADRRALREMTADRDRWRREFEAAAKYVEENARLWAEVRRLERALAGGVGPLADSDAGARDSEEGCGAMASSGNRIPHG
jgi:hypothetical protein